MYTIGGRSMYLGKPISHEVLLLILPNRFYLLRTSMEGNEKLLGAH
jgi:hypothetical protein